MTRPLSVLYFSNSLVRGGAEEHVLTLLRGLDRRKFEPHLVCTPEVAEQIRRDLPDDVALTPIRLRRPRQVGQAARLAGLLHARRVDVLHSHLFYASLFASPIGSFCRVSLIVETPHIREHWRGGVKGHFVVDRAVARFVDRYIAVSRANAQYLIQDKRLPREKITVIHNGCDLSRFDPSTPAPAGLRAQLGIRADDPILLVAGRLEPQKGHGILLEALPQVRAHFPRVRLICAGEGALRGELEELARALRLDDAVRFVGFQRDITPWLALADVTVLPSRYEGLPLVAIESLAAGRPMVATSVDGTPEVIVHERTGLTVEPGSPDRLALAICRLLGSPEERARMATAGRAWVVEHFDQREQVRRTEELYLSGFRLPAPTSSGIVRSLDAARSLPSRGAPERR